MIILKNFFKSILSFFVFLRFKNVMDLYEYMAAKNIRSGVLNSVFRYMCEKKGCYIGYFVRFGNRPYFPHGLNGIFISDASVIGKNAVIFHQVTIGSVRMADSSDNGNPVIGDNCYIGAGAKIIGNITIGDNVRIGANAVVYTDVPSNSIVVNSPTRIIRKNAPPDNRFVVLRHDGAEEVWTGSGFAPFSRER